MTARRRVVVTGMGIVSAAGTTVEGFWRHVSEGRSAIRRIRRFDASAFPSQIGGEIDAESLPASALLDACAPLGTIARFAAAAVAQALEDAGPVAAGTRRRTGVVIASGCGTGTHAEIVGPTAAAASAVPFDWEAFASELRRVGGDRAAERRSPGSIPAQIATHCGFHGPIMSVMTACAGGTQAIGDAVRWIRAGEAVRVVAGGADSELYPMGVASFCLLGALSRRNDAPAEASRPFDAHRDGFVIGEGGAALVLEDREHAIARGARIYAEVAGFGSASDAWRVTDPHPEGRGAVLAMTRALHDARVGPADVGYINAHGTSTRANDRIETCAIRRVFGDRAPRIPVSSTKSMIGHATVAAGAIEAVATIMTLVRQFVHPTINLDVADPECDLDYVPRGGRAAALDVAISNSFAFGGQSATAVFARHR